MCWRVCTSHSRAYKLVAADWHISVMLQACARSATAEKSRTGHVIAGNYSPISNLGTISKVIERAGMSAPPLTRFQEFRPVQSAYGKQHSTETALLEVLDNAYAAADDKQVTVFAGLNLSAAFYTVSHDTAPTPADWVRNDWNGFVVAPVLPQLLVTVCQALQPPVTSRQPKCRHPSRIRTGTHPVCRLLQSSGWCHSWAWRTVPPVCWQHSSILPCALTTQPLVSQCSLHAHPMSDCGTCRMVCNLILTSLKLCSSERDNSWSKQNQPCHLWPSLVSTYRWLRKWKCSVWLPDFLRQNMGDFCPSVHPCQLAKLRLFPQCTVPT